MEYLTTKSVYPSLAPIFAGLALTGNSFERKEILRVVHSLASYRPSLIALQYVPLSSCIEQNRMLDKC